MRIYGIPEIFSRFKIAASAVSRDAVGREVSHAIRGERRGVLKIIILGKPANNVFTNNVNGMQFY